MPIWETSLCASLWIFLVVRACYAVFEASRDYQDYIEYALDPPSSPFGNSKDATDSEWNVWHDIMRNGFYLWLIGQVVLGQLNVYLHLQKYRAMAFAVYGLVAVCQFIGIPAVLMIVAHTTVLCTVAWFTASQLAVWIISISFLFTFNFSFTQALMVDLGVITDGGSMLPEYGICMSVVRSTSAALYICDVCSGNVSPRNETISEDKSRGDDGREPTSREPSSVSCVIDILCYVWYLPLFFAGPLVTFENFYQQVRFFLSFF